MKQLQIADSLLKVLLLAGFFTACHNDQIIAPMATEKITENDRNAKLSNQLKLVKDGDAMLEYVKSGKFIGRISKVTDANINGYHTEYIYDDNNGASDLHITSTRYSNINSAVVEEVKYHISNGRCIASQNITNNQSYEHKYNGNGFLSETKALNGPGDLNYEYSYDYNVITKEYQLSSINTIKNQTYTDQITFTYSSKPVKYFLNPDHTLLDPYLQIFGKFSGSLAESVAISPYNSVGRSYNFTYTMDNSGYVTSRSQEYHPILGSNKGVIISNKAFEYSFNWL